MAFTQPAKFGEEWNDDRVKSYLNRLPPVGESADFHVLYNAYKHMRANDFERFLVFFLADGRDVNATNPEGKTLLDLAKEHPTSSEFVTVLTNIGQ
jgi:ankyrin repeat protein